MATSRQTLNRVDSLRLPASAYKTYGISAPLSTHWRPAKCAEVECEAYRLGWRTIVPADGPAADYMRHDKSRRHVETRPGPGMACFTFEPGQQGFAPAHDHRKRIERQERFLLRGGDWRGCPDGMRREFKRPDEWVDSFADHQSRLATIVGRG